jgi:phosphatidylinositol-bisphosphatase
LLDFERHLSISLRKSSAPILADHRSYKYVHGSTTLDTRRPAAYTDRVLYTTPSTAPSATSPEAVSMVTAGTYTSHDILWSDHRPVTCDFQVQVRVADEEKRKVELAQVRSELDKLDEEWAPSIEVDQSEIDFGDIR